MFLHREAKNNMLTNFWNWLSKSSANPAETSLTAKALMTSVIPFILQATHLACGLAVCVSLDQSTLTTVIGVLSDIVFWALSLYSAIGFLYGITRKVSITAAGTNPVV